MHQNFHCYLFYDHISLVNIPWNARQKGVKILICHSHNAQKIQLLGNSFYTSYILKLIVQLIKIDAKSWCLGTWSNIIVNNVLNWWVLVEYYAKILFNLIDFNHQIDKAYKYQRLTRSCSNIQILSDRIIPWVVTGVDCYYSSLRIDMAATWSTKTRVRFQLQNLRERGSPTYYHVLWIISAYIKSWAIMQ